MENERWAKLEVWKIGNDLAYQVYMATKSFPREEVYGITSRVGRAALTVPTNIIGGCSRKGDKELFRFISINLGNLAETKYLLYFSNRLGYFANAEYIELKK